MSSKPATAFVGPAGSAVRLAATLIGLGIALRLLLFWTDNSVITDEAKLAVNLLARGYLDLFPPLEHDQSAPILFLWLVKPLTDLFGPGELALRAVPLISGVLILLLAYPGLYRPLGPLGAAIATGFMAVSPGLVQYSAIFKQYALEALVTLILVKLTFDALSDSSRASARWLLAGGVVAPWASAPSAFILVPVLAALNRDRRLMLRAAALWGCSYALAYALIYRYASANPYMQRFWETAFLTPDSPGALSQFLRVTRGLLWGGLSEDIPIGYDDPVRVTLVHLTTLGLATFAGFGVIRLYRAGGMPTLLPVVGPLVLAVGAALGGVYPYSRRVMIFALPLLAILVGAGVSAGFSRPGSVGRRAARAALAGLVFFPVILVGMLTAILRGSPARTLIAVQQEQRAGEPIYISAPSMPEWIYYTTEWAHPDRARLAMLNRVSRPGGPSFYNAPSRGPIPSGTGTDLVWPSSKGDELFGLATGLEFRAGRGYPGTSLDRGWLENESARIRAAAAPGVWILLRAAHGPELELLDAIGASGGRQTLNLTRPGITLARYEFP